MVIIMNKKNISLILCLTILLSVCSLSASALIDTTVIYGDVDGNKVVDTDDVSAVLKHVASLQSITDTDAAKRCDVNGDGYITIYDARQILRSCASLANIQPTGPEGYQGSDVPSNIGTENAVLMFNAVLNKIKTDMPGFTRSETSDVEYFNIESVKLSGISMGETASSVSKAIEGMIVKESEPEAIQTSLKGDNCDNAMSVEKETYVSRLKESEIYGVKYSENKETGMVTIEIALPDAELDNISYTPFADVFNIDILKENSENVIENVFGSTSLNDAVRKGIKNCVLKVVYEAATAEVVSYTTTYTTDMYIKNSTVGINGGILSAELSGIAYMTTVSVTYDQFQWTVE